jgi:hypothetical protein
MYIGKSAIHHDSQCVISKAAIPSLGKENWKSQTYSIPEYTPEAANTYYDCIRTLLEHL